MNSTVSTPLRLHRSTACRKRIRPGGLSNLSPPATCTAILVAVLFWHSIAGAATPFDSLKQRLLAEGYARRQLDQIFTPDVRPQFNTVARNMRIREGHLNYGQFLKPDRIEQATRFLADYRQVFTVVERDYGVDRHVIAAVLLVETGIGRYTGKTPTLAVLSTYAVMNRKRNRDLVWKRLRSTDRKRWGRARFDEKLKQRARWALTEIQALLRATEDDPQRLKSLRGSPMGAIGWPQFLPSSLLDYGTDGNDDGVIDLYSPEDAIHSVANYLLGYGWNPRLNQAAREAVIYQYNHSKPYVKTVMELAERLRAREGEHPATGSRTAG